MSPRVFIGWSSRGDGVLSKQTAMLLRTLLKNASGHWIDAWTSETDTPIGTRYFDRLLAGLHGVKRGLFCMTAENVNARWLAFECGVVCSSLSGAYAKASEQAPGASPDSDGSGKADLSSQMRTDLKEGPVYPLLLHGLESRVLHEAAAFGHFRSLECCEADLRSFISDLMKEFPRPENFGGVFNFDTEFRTAWNTFEAGYKTHRDRYESWLASNKKKDPSLKEWKIIALIYKLAEAVHEAIDSDAARIQSLPELRQAIAMALCGVTPLPSHELPGPALALFRRIISQVEPDSDIITLEDMTDWLRNRPAK